MNSSMQETRLRGSAHFPFERYDMQTHQAPIHVACHWQEDTELLSVRHGEIAILLEDELFSLQPGDVACINPHQLHGIRGCTADTAYDAYVFPISHLLFACEEQDQLQYTRQLSEGTLGFPRLLPQGTLACRLVQEVLALDRTRPAAYQLLIKAHLLQLIGALAQANAFVPRTPSRENDLCRAILTYIQQHYADACTVAEVALAVGLSPAYFSAFFSHHFAQHYSDYLLNYRMEQACSLLLHTDKSITDVAFLTGFHSSSYFIACFRRLKGITPLAYRRQMR